MIENMDEYVKIIDELIIKIKKKTIVPDTIFTIKCPICKGTMQYFITGFNGHVHGKCETNNCLSFAE